MSVNKNKTRRLFMAMALGFGLFVTGCGSNGSKNGKSEEETKTAVAEASAKSDTDESDPMNRKIDFDKLADVNEDIYAWIYVPGTTIDYPVVQAEAEEKTYEAAEVANEYYLRRDLNGNDSEFGTIYTEVYNQKDFSDPVTVMYGHTAFMDEIPEGKEMFTDLHNFEDASYLAENPYFYVYTPENTYKYEVFCANTFPDTYLLGNYAFQIPAVVQSFVEELESTMDANVNNDMDVDVNKDSKLLVLSTCVEVGGDTRYLVSAVPVETK